MPLSFERTMLRALAMNLRGLSAALEEMLTTDADEPAARPAQPLRLGKDFVPCSAPCDDHPCQRARAIQGRAAALTCEHASQLRPGQAAALIRAFERELRQVEAGE